MYDNGKSLRMGILVKDFNEQAANLLQIHNWKYEIEKSVDDGEYILVKIQKNSVIKKFAILYSQDTKKEVYSQIEREADACFINGLSFNKNCSFSKDFNKPLTTLNELLEVLKDWNCEINAETSEEPLKEAEFPKEIYLNAENPSEQCWMMIRALKSSEICKRFISEKHNGLTDETINNKAKGISFLIQNACDYFDIAQKQNLTQRLLSLYYGCLSFMEADILVNSDNYPDLRSVEEITKQGHGLYTYLPSENYDISSLYTGVLKHGLFPAWLKNLNYDTSVFSASRAKKLEDINEYCYLFNKIFNRIPELSFLMRIVDKNYKTGFFKPSYNHRANMSGNSFMSTKGGYQSEHQGTYVVLYDDSLTSTLEMTKKIIGPVEQHSVSTFNEYEESNIKANAYSIFVRHNERENEKYWWQVLNIHKSNYSQSSILIPLTGLKDDWEVYAIMGLYTFSIIVRYYPNLWRRMQYGEWDKYYAVCLQFAMIVEKVLPHIFYERISGQKLTIASNRYI